MKHFNLINRHVRALFLPALIATISLSSSCKKETVDNPDPVPSASLSDANLSSFATTAAAVKTKYKIVAPINLYNKSNVTISYDSIAGGSTACIQLINCTNVHITHCRLGNSKSFGILIGNSSNILVDSCYISKTATGILALSCPKGMIRIQYNQLQNMQGPFPQGASIQFSGVGGPYNRVQFNKIQNVVGQSHPEDAISIYKSNGLATDPICVINNNVQGGGPSTTGTGIILGDGGGSNQTAQNNSVVNSGAMGMQVAGGTHIQISNNKIYSAAFAWSHMGLGCGNYSGAPSNNITISGNQVNWLSGNPKDQINGAKTRVMNSSYQAGTPMPIGWLTNVLGAAINTSIIPVPLLNFNLF